MQWPIIVDASDWPIGVLYKEAQDIKIENGRVLAHVGYMSISFDEFMELGYANDN